MYIHTYVHTMHIRMYTNVCNYGMYNFICRHVYIGTYICRYVSMYGYQNNYELNIYALSIHKYFNNI